jgi:hypothetical protein
VGGHPEAIIGVFRMHARQEILLDPRCRLATHEKEKVLPAAIVITVDAATDKAVDLFPRRVDASLVLVEFAALDAIESEPAKRIVRVAEGHEPVGLLREEPLWRESPPAEPTGARGVVADLERSPFE